VLSFGFDLDEFVQELTEAVLGDTYPTPDRMLVFAEQVVRRYLDWAMCSDAPPAGKFDLFATEGGTGAICYVFRSLVANRILNKGDTIAIATPIFTPYLEIPELEDYAFNVVHVRLRQEDGFQLTDGEVAKLADPKVKALFLVNPGNPTSVALNAQSRGKVMELVQSKRPDLIILTDDVYGTFVTGFRSLLADLPQNTIGVYSFSKYFGCTGWRLGVIALHENNILDRMIAALPEADKSALDRRYGSLTLDPRKIKMINRFVADSRDVAQNHTAGLGTPQQAMMVLLSLTELMDEKKEYQSRCMEMLRERVETCADGLGIGHISDPMFAAYYGEIDLEFWLRKYAGDDVVAWIKQKVHPLDIVFKLAEDYGVVALNGSGFQGPNWSCRVSFANLNDSAYEDIGRAIRSVARGYVQAFRASEDQPPAKSTAALANAK
jgi:aspartate 4-decarboxylase